MTDLSPNTRVKSWWAPLWRGLVADSTAKHYRSMRNAVWLFLYFVIHADRKTGKLVRRFDTIVKETGFARRTVRHWLAILKRHNYVSVEHAGKSLSISIQVQKWKPLPLKTERLQRPGD